ncbi:MAG: cytochrome P450 [Trichodesmium sp. MAG_R03]|nr:cytochrome P450 [Trichodesmium sp. MAG_R03]
MRLVLATLLSNFDMELAENQTVKPQRRGVTLAPKGGVKMLMKSKRIQSQKNLPSLQLYKIRTYAPALNPVRANGIRPYI